jgi:hypothetical protein
VAVPVGNTVTVIEVGQDLSYVLKNLGPETVWVQTNAPEFNGSSVTADTSPTGGYPIDPGEVLYLNNPSTSTQYIYGITASGTSYVAITGTGVGE